MQTDKWLWVPWVVGILGGGAMGAVIAAFVSYRRSKRQPVWYGKEIIHVFRKTKNFENLRARLLVKEGPVEDAQEVSVDNLSLARYTLINKGNQDINEFKFGITMKGSNRIIDLRMSSPDRHHIMTVSYPEHTDESFINKPDFTLVPFNRGDTYGVDIYFTYEHSPGGIELSSPHAATLVPTNIVPGTESKVVIQLALWQVVTLTILYLILLILNALQFAGIIKAFAP